MDSDGALALITNPDRSTKKGGQILKFQSGGVQTLFSVLGKNEFFSLSVFVRQRQSPPPGASSLLLVRPREKQARKRAKGEAP